MIMSSAALRNGKSAGNDEISAELIKQGGTELVKELTKVCNRLWTKEKVPEDWKEGIIIPIPKIDLGTLSMES